MKHFFYSLIILFLLGICAPGKAQNAFNKGVNLTGWFSSGSARSIPFYKFTKKDLERIAEIINSHIPKEQLNCLVPPVTA